jgi:rubrerythrin
MRYSLPEIVELAVQTEQGGKMFYEAVAARTQDAVLKQLFQLLAEEETNHIATFVELGRRVRVAPEELPYNWEEATLYLKSIVDSRYFLGKDKALALAGESKDAEETLGHALGFEKETLLFYAEILSMVSERNQQPVRELIEQERQHVRKLQELRSAL